MSRSRDRRRRADRRARKDLGKFAPFAWGPHLDRWQHALEFDAATVRNVQAVQAVHARQAGRQRLLAAYAAGAVHLPLPD